jgi:NADH:ubiquinone oxidoreductase subunit 4 (subunit M)
MVLAAILLKLGTFGIIRFSIVLLPLASDYFLPFIYILNILGIIYSSFSTIRQIDLKRIVAYSSISHMALTTLGLFTKNEEALQGA